MASLSYWISPSGPRPLRAHGFTIHSLLLKRWRENTTALALIANFGVPAMQSCDQGLQRIIDSGSEDVPSKEEITALAIASLKTGALQLVDVSSRIAVQTALACVLIDRNTPLGNSVVFEWDMYPRLHQKYVSEFLGRLHLPRVIATILGPRPNATDVDYFAFTGVSASAAFQDAAKRNVLAFVSDVLVSGVSILLKARRGAGAGAAKNTSKSASKATQAAGDKKEESVGAQLTVLVITQTCTLAGRCLGATLGSRISPGTGEYWLEQFSGAVFTTVGRNFARQLVA